MFLLNGLYSKYFGMNTSFRISLMYLLLLIPQHGNSPLPVMESWLKKDQDDGFIQRDMTSSLTGGDESFGSAHQTYQNSLIRKKKDNYGNAMPAANYRNYPIKYDQNQYEPNEYFKSLYMNKDYSVPGMDKERTNPMYQPYEVAKIPYSKYLSETLDLKSSLMEPREASYLDMGNNKRNFLKGNMKYLNSRSSGSEGNLMEDFGKNDKWSMCKRLKSRYAPNSFSMLQSDRNPLHFDDNMAFQNDYSSIEDEQTGRQFRNQELSIRPEGKGHPVFDENEYYEAEAGPMNGEGDLNIDEEDYNQMLNEHALMHKRDDRKQLENYPNMQNSQYGAVGLNLNAPESSKSRNTREGSYNPELLWKLSSNLRSKELDTVMRNSQRALQEVQKLQQKLAYKATDSNDNDAFKRPIRDESLSKTDKNKMKIDEKRLKREDEDEQKNMKTGTDEGGGGEYEDEEGKGHKDEEEYYEDADLSDEESGTDVQKSSDLNQKYVKREVDKDAQTKNTKEKDESNGSDYELNLENAPVENAEKSRRVSYRERGKTKNSSVRKGVKIWDEWGKWSPCSVSCGVGRSTRWRHCIGGGCAQGEKEAQIKRCTNPAC